MITNDIHAASSSRALSPELSTSRFAGLGAAFDAWQDRVRPSVVGTGAAHTIAALSTGVVANEVTTHNCMSVATDPTAYAADAHLTADAKPAAAPPRGEPR